MARRSPDAPVLSIRALNRALLARQMLLERAAMPVARAIEHLVALQAQVPGDPYIALWSRLQNFDPEELSSLIAAGKAVRMASLRATVHLSTANDARMLRPWVQPMVTRVLASTPFGKSTRGVDREALIAAAAAAVAGAPKTLAKLRPALANAFPDFSANDLSYVFHYLIPLVQVPPRGLWRKSGAPTVTTLTDWVGKPLLKPSPEKLVLRYLAAFGPASEADARAWSGVSELKPLFERLRPRLVSFRDERGTELFDLPEAPRPDADMPAPPRFLPSYDNVIIAFANRERILPGGGPIPFQNVNVGTFLIDGFFAGFWRIKQEKANATLLIAARNKLGRSDKAALTAEGRALLAFAAQGSDHRVEFAAA